MAKNKDAVAENPVVETTTAATTGPAVEALPQGPNYTIQYRRDHPGDRCSYGIAGNAGIIVFDKGLFKDGIAPAEIGLTCEMVQPKADNKTAKAEAAAAKLAEKAAKAQARIEEQQKRAAEKVAKAEAAAKAAADRVAAAQAAKVAATATTAPATGGTPTT